jgi:hypothetical protein
MIDTAVPTALRGEIGGGLIALAPDVPERAAAEEATDPGREEVVIGFSIFLAESCNRVFTTEYLVTSSIC